LHQPFSELWAMDVEELVFWTSRATWVLEQENRQR
jgi:hypothetical protein